MQLKYRELPPLRNRRVYFEEIEAHLSEFLRQFLYFPLLDVIGEEHAVLKNSISELLDAISSGRIAYSDGAFSGSFNAAISKALKGLGAQWDRRQGSWRIPPSKLPADVSIAIGTSQARMQETVNRINSRLSKIQPSEIDEKLKLDHLYDSTIHKIDKDFVDSVKQLSVKAKFTPEQQKRFREEYVKNMRLYIREWTGKEIVELRNRISMNVAKGLRYEDLVKTIQHSYGVTSAKATFLARQETSLLMTKIRQVRYTDAGVNEYKWRCVAGSPAHPVRPMHKALDGKIFAWDNPPVTDEQGHRKHPGQDYNCRCIAIPIVRF